MSNRMRNVIVLTSLISFCIKAFGVSEGFYIGVMTGPATNNASQMQAQILNSSAFVTAKPKSQIWGSRFFLGYMFNSFAGGEVGLSYFSDIHYDTNNVQTCSNLSARIRNIDVVGKVGLAYLDWFDFYAKGGVAVVYETTAGAFNPPPPGQTCGRNTYNSKFRPTFSFGFSYNFTQSFLADISLNTVMVGKPINNVDHIAIGLSYHFVDRYCGQFLCDD